MEGSLTTKNTYLHLSDRTKKFPTTNTLAYFSGVRDEEEKGLYSIRNGKKNPTSEKGPELNLSRCRSYNYFSLTYTAKNTCVFVSGEFFRQV